ncbi:MAG: methionine--tRNA ligase subunit beta [Candidatus Pacebacteria bacterium]|jgi:methionyl-tRNA synthetase|nr:methionine--tRNA ligase subunit beta [Candidatus Paceibacterota bacterium]
MISFEDFSKLELKIAKVLEANRVEGSIKLLQLQISLGTEVRQIIAGIGLYYSPEDLIGKEIVVVANLEPKKLMGLESQGMLLAASEDGKIALLVPDKDMTPGANIH